MSLFDEILAKVPEGEREILAKYPELKANVERAEALAGEVDKQKTTMADWDTRLRGWESWKLNNWDDAKGMPKGQIQAQEEAAAARRELAELQARGEVNDMTFEEILAGLQGKGFVTKDDVAKTLKESGVVDAKTIDQRFAQMDDGMSYIYGATAHLPLEHSQEFGKPMKVTDLFKYMSEHKLADPQLAYDRMVEPLRRAKQEEVSAARTKEIDDLKAHHAEEVERIKREAADAAQAAQLSAPSPLDAGVGHAGVRLTRPTHDPNAEGPKIPEKVELGQGDLAASLAKFYREQKGLPAAN